MVPTVPGERYDFFLSRGSVAPIGAGKWTDVLTEKGHNSSLETTTFLLARASWKQCTRG